MTYEEAKCYKTLRTSYLCISVVIAADTVISLTALVVVVPLAAILVVLTITVLIPIERTGWSFNSFSKKYQAKKVFIFPIDNQKSHFWIVYPVKFWKKKLRTIIQRATLHLEECRNKIYSTSPFVGPVVLVVPELIVVLGPPRLWALLPLLIFAFLVTVSRLLSEYYAYIQIRPVASSVFLLPLLLFH